MDRADTILMLCLTILATVSYTRSDDSTKRFHITRNAYNDVIRNATDSSECSQFHQASWLYDECRCESPNVFYVVDQIAGCYSTKQIEPSKTFI